MEEKLLPATVQHLHVLDRRVMERLSSICIVRSRHVAVRVRCCEQSQTGLKLYYLSAYLSLASPVPLRKASPPTKKCHAIIKSPSRVIKTLMRNGQPLRLVTQHLRPRPAQKLCIHSIKLCRIAVDFKLLLTLGSCSHRRLHRWRRLRPSWGRRGRSRICLGCSILLLSLWYCGG